MQEHVAEIAEEEFVVGHKLADPETGGAVQEFPLEPQFGQARRWCGFDGRDRIHAADIVAPDAAGVVNLKGIRIQRQILPTGQLR